MPIYRMVSAKSQHIGMWRALLVSLSTCLRVYIQSQQTSRLVLLQQKNKSDNIFLIFFFTHSEFKEGKGKKGQLRPKLNFETDKPV